MKRIQLIVLALILSISAVAQFSVNGRFTPNGTSQTQKGEAPGVENIYIFKTLLGASISYETESNNAVNIYTYQNSIADKTPVASSNITSSTIGTRTTYTVSNLQDSRGLLMDDNNQSRVVWIIDYSQHRPQLSSIVPEEAEDKCDALKLLINKNDLLEYRGTGGQVREIVREYSLSYQLWEWNEDAKAFQEITYTTDPIAIVGTELILNGGKFKVPNMDTEFTLSGDQFGKAFNDPVQKVSALYKAVRVEAHIIAIQEERDNANEQKEEGNLNTSAPLHIDFYGYGNKPTAYFFTWYIYNKNDMKNHIARYTDENMSYTFDHHGEYQVVFEVANSESSCVVTDSRDFSIGESDLKIPNFFSPRSSPGSNDEFRVSYKSLIKFRMAIVNRWGNKVFESSNPAEGWDGRYKGKLVNPGVYFYRIEATGSEGKKWNKAGDINIL